MSQIDVVFEEIAEISFDGVVPWVFLVDPGPVLLLEILVFPLGPPLPIHVDGRLLLAGCLPHD